MEPSLHDQARPDITSETSGVMHFKLTESGPTLASKTHKNLNTVWICPQSRSRLQECTRVNSSIVRFGRDTVLK